jgi:hypothetical protein
LPDDDVRRACAEQSLLAVNAMFPSPEFSSWPDCQKLLSHEALRRAGWHACRPGHIRHADPAVVAALHTLHI